MPRYGYNVVFNSNAGRGRADYFEPVEYSGLAAEFAKATLLRVLARNPGLADALVAVNVWDAAVGEVGYARPYDASFTTWDLDDFTPPPNLLYASFHTYYLLSTGYDDYPDDAVLGDDGQEINTPLPYGLVVPGEGPALKIRTGHNAGWITVDAEILDHAPDDDLASWEAAEQVTIKPQGELRLTAWNNELTASFPDLGGLAEAGYLAIRVSARGRDRPLPPVSGDDPRRHPVEHHRIQTWPAASPSPRTVLKKDAVSVYWESQAGP